MQDEEVIVTEELSADEVVKTPEELAEVIEVTADATDEVEVLETEDIGE
jgi:hypothetical protein